MLWPQRMVGKLNIFQRTLQLGWLTISSIYRCDLSWRHRFGGHSAASCDLRWHESFVQQNYDWYLIFWQYGLSPYYHTTEDTLDIWTSLTLLKVCKLTIGTLASMQSPPASFLEMTSTSLSKVMSYLTPHSSCANRETGTHNESANVTINIQMRKSLGRTNSSSWISIPTHFLQWTSTDE